MTSIEESTEEKERRYIREELVFGCSSIFVANQMLNTAVETVDEVYEALKKRISGPSSSSGMLISEEAVQNIKETVIAQLKSTEDKFREITGQHMHVPPEIADLKLIDPTINCDPSDSDVSSEDIAILEKQYHSLKEQLMQALEEERELNEALQLM